MLAVDFVHGSAASVFYHSLQFVEFWKKLWHAKGPWKVKIHRWKACKTILSTVSHMQSRRMYLSNGYYLCNAELETIEHVCRDCPFTHDFLFNFLDLQSLPRVSSALASFFHWMVFCSEALSKA